MKIFRILLFVVCLALIGVHIYEMNYYDMSFKTNGNHYLGIVALLFIGVSMLTTILNDKKNNK
jgi:putative Mn2+ efflux pump MntP